MGMFSWDETGTLKFFNKAKGFGYVASPNGDVFLPGAAFKGNLEKTEFKDGATIGFNLGPSVPGKKSRQAKLWNLK